jgi:prolyl-tRNA synthetase
MFKAKNEFFAVCIRGDLELNEAKLAALLKAGEVTLAAEADVERLTGAPIGFAGPVGLKQLPVIACQSAAALFGALSGANLRDKHYKNVCYGRDWQAQLIADLRVVKAGDRCVKCGAALYEKKGNELGHIFKLGKKYTLAMKLNYLDEAGVEQTPTMGCYGIGLDRTIAAVIEEHHDEHGIIWPMTLAPFHVVVIPIQNNAAVEEAALKLCAELESLGVEVLLDDRTERPGVRFNDADLMGIPFRVVIGEKNLLQAKVEVKRRGEASAKLIDAVCAAEQLALEVKNGIDALKTGS